MSARPQVTITLGQTGQLQVVKRVITTVDVSNSDYHPSSEGKRSIRERLGNNMDSLHDSLHNKRQRTDNYNLSNNQMDDERQRMSSILKNTPRHHDYHMCTNTLHLSERFSFAVLTSLDGRVSQNDLRHKLMSKGLSRSKIGSKEQNGEDLREKLSRSSRMPLRFESQQDLLESRVSSLSRRIPPARSADDLLHLDSSRKSYSLALDGQRCISPDGLLGAYRRMSPLRSYDEVYDTPLIRPYGDSRLQIARSLAATSRPADFVSKAIPVTAAKSILQAPPGVVRKPLYLSEVPLTVSGLLHSLDLGKYAINFQAEEVQKSFRRELRSKRM